MDKDWWFNSINRYYNTKKSDGTRLWNIDRVRKAVELEIITTEQFKQITNEDYTSPSV